MSHILCTGRPLPWADGWDPERAMPGQRLHCGGRCRDGDSACCRRGASATAESSGMPPRSAVSTAAPVDGEARCERRTGTAATLHSATRRGRGPKPTSQESGRPSWYLRRATRLTLEPTLSFPARRDHSQHENNAHSSFVQCVDSIYGRARWVSGRGFRGDQAAPAGNQGYQEILETLLQSKEP